jgi:hypothetical protein
MMMIDVYLFLTLVVGPGQETSVLGSISLSLMIDDDLDVLMDAAKASIVSLHGFSDEVSCFSPRRAPLLLALIVYDDLDASMHAAEASIMSLDGPMGDFWLVEGAACVGSCGQINRTKCTRWPMIL